MYDDHRSDPPSRTRTLAVLVAAATSLALVVPLLGATAASAGDPAAVTALQGEETDGEEPYVEPAPGPGDEYFEAADEGNWISYINPRDEYHRPFLGDASGKICVTLLNADGEVIVGETVPNTTITIPTGESTEWHSQADPVTVDLPMTDHYDRPLDADQFGTSPDLPQGDGYMDSHCVEFHGLPEGETIEYGEAQIEGEHADDVELVGYVEQPNQDWNTDVDPIEDAESYDDVGGSWTFQSEKHERLHGQVAVVLQLADDGSGDGGDGDGSDGGTDTANSSDGGDGTGDDGTGGDGTDGAAGGTFADSTPGVGVVAGLFAVAAILSAAVGRVRWG